MLKETEKLMMEAYNIKPHVFELYKQALNDVEEQFKIYDEIREYNQLKVLNAFQEERISDMHFTNSSGYGYDDIGRDTLDKVYARIFNTESALVRPHFVNGTHAIGCALMGNLRTNDTMLCITGTPYDTLHNIIGISGDSILNGYIVDRGKDDGIEKGMVVISADGLVGQVSSVGKNWAIVQCIVNENVKVAVMVDSTRENTGILQGYKDYFNNNLAKVLNLPMDSEVKEGDVIVTSGLGGYYPKEIKIGEVVSVEEDRVKVMKSAIVKPYVDFNKIEELFIVAPKDKREIKYD